jgi:biofilm PGA synthesis N-glycosyltransferase PgaC
MIMEAAVTLLFVFLVLLVGRYALFLWLGYLHHMENRADAESDAVVALPRLTIIVPVFNEAAVIQNALHSLLTLDYPSYDIVVVDDGSSDDTRALAARLEGNHGRVTVRVVTKPNGGKASALNAGIALAHTPFVVCMDGDSRLAPDALRHAMRHFADPRIAAVAGNVKVVNRNNIWTRLQALEYIEGLNMPRRAQGFLRVVNIVPGPIGVFRRDVLQSVGGYETDTFAEDADVTLKIVTAGWHIAYDERAIAWTEAPETYLDLVKQRYRWTRGILQALRKRATWRFMRHGDLAARMSLALMLFEAVLWPMANVIGGVAFSITALSFGATVGVLYWWVLLAMVDVAAGLYSLSMEGEDLQLLPYAIAYRLFFITMVDVAKLFATVEELAHVPMTWGKLARAGRI